MILHKGGSRVDTTYLLVEVDASARLSRVVGRVPRKQRHGSAVWDCVLL